MRLPATNARRRPSGETLMRFTNPVPEMAICETARRVLQGSSTARISTAAATVAMAMTLRDGIDGRKCAGYTGAAGRAGAFAGWTAGGAVGDGAVWAISSAIF